MTQFTSITADKILEFIKYLLKDEVLSKIQEDLVRGIWNNLEYFKIADRYGYTISALKKPYVYRDLFNCLGIAIERQYGVSVKITKVKFCEIIKIYYKKYEYELKENQDLLEEQKKLAEDKIKIFDTLQKQINKCEPEQKTGITQFMKYCLMQLYEQTSDFMSTRSTTIEYLVEKIENLENPKTFNCLNSISINEDLDELVKKFFIEALEKLRQVLNVSEQDYNKWTANPIREQPETIEQSNERLTRNYYLMLKIVQSSNQLQESPQYRIEEAFFLDSSCYPPKKEDYKTLNKTIKDYEIEQQQSQYKEYYDPEELKPILTLLIRRCFEQINSGNLVIEFFCNQELLSEDFDSWKCEWMGADSPLSILYQPYVRDIARLDTQYQQIKLLKDRWKDKWKQICHNINISDHGKTWMNLCQSNSEDLKPLFRNLLLDGIPVAIWSRCYGQCGNHRREIDDLVNDCNGDITQLSNIIGQRRSNAPSGESEDLGHNLSLLWEDPNLVPPFALLTSG